MTSDRVIQANRRNARASTGPRTAKGKGRSARNAHTHGLTAKNSDLFAAAEVERLTDLIVGELGADPLLKEAARTVAETQTHLRRVQAVKSAIVQGSASLVVEGANENGLPDLGLGADLLNKLERLDRYERRAFSRRTTAIRRFDELASRARRQ